MRKSVESPWLRLLIVLILGLIWIPQLIHGVNSVLGAQPKYEFVTTHHEQYNFSITHPKQWRTTLFGDSGVKGNEEIKLHSLNGGFLAKGPNIYIRHRPGDHPTLQQVEIWGDASVRGLGSYSKYEEIDRYEDTVNEEQVIRHIYRFGEYIYEEVYFAKPQGMFVIEIQSSEREYYRNKRAIEILINSFQ